MTVLHTRALERLKWLVRITFLSRINGLNRTIPAAKVQNPYCQACYWGFPSSKAPLQKSAGEPAAC